MTNIRVLSLNTFGAPFLSKDISRRFNLLADEFTKNNPDVLCLQEVVLYPHLSLLRKLLPHYPYAAFKRFLYGPKGGLVILSKFPLEDIRFSDFTKRGSLTNKSLVGRIMRYGILKAKIKDLPISILTTHLTPNLDIEYSTDNRYTQFHVAQLQEVAKAVHEERLWKRGVILTGDFNIPAGSYLYGDFIEASGLTDVFSGKHRSTYHENFLPDGKTQGQIDYIFTTTHDGMLHPLGSDFILHTPMKMGEESFYLTDHLGLIADVKVTFPNMQFKNVN